MIPFQEEQQKTGKLRWTLIFEPRVLNHQAVSQRQTRRIQQEIGRRPVLLSYGAAGRLSGLSAPQEQACFLNHTYRWRRFAIVAETTFVVFDHRACETYFWRRPLSAFEVESNEVLHWFADLWSRSKVDRILAPAASANANFSAVP